jgi:molecular chaperone GrpE
VIALASIFRRPTPADAVDTGTMGTTEQSDETIEVSARMIAGLDGGGDTTGGTDSVAEPSESSVTEELLEQALTERKALVQLCLYALDRARSPGVVERLEQGLAGIGVAALRPDGDVFDPAHHEAGGTVPTDDTAIDGLVAETEVVGFEDRGRLLRAPIVTVYKAQS